MTSTAPSCGGVVVARARARRLVLTAAHCVETRAADSIDVVIGADNLCRDRSIDGLRIHVSGIAIHPAYHAESATFDLALLALALDAPSDSVRNIGFSMPGVPAKRPPRQPSRTPPLQLRHPVLVT